MSHAGADSSFFKHKRNRFLVFVLSNKPSQTSWNENGQIGEVPGDDVTHPSTRQPFLMRTRPFPHFPEKKPIRCVCVILTVTWPVAATTSLSHHPLKRTLSPPQGNPPTPNPSVKSKTFSVCLTLWMPRSMLYFPWPCVCVLVCVCEWMSDVHALQLSALYPTKAALNDTKTFFHPLTLTYNLFYPLDHLWIIYNQNCTRTCAI